MSKNKTEPQAADEPARIQVVLDDEALMQARVVALAALAEITNSAQIGLDAGVEVVDERTLTLLFATNAEGYHGWFWAATVTQVDAESPVTVLEVGLIPGPESLLAPERLAQFRKARAREAAAEAAAAEAAASELDDDDDSDDLLDNDFSDFDGELDGVDFESDDHDDDDDDDSADADENGDSDE